MWQKIPQGRLINSVLEMSLSWGKMCGQRSKENQLKRWSWSLLATKFQAKCLCFSNCPCKIKDENTTWDMLFLIVFCKWIFPFIVKIGLNRIQVLMIPAFFTFLGLLCLNDPVSGCCSQLHAYLYNLKLLLENSRIMCWCSRLKWLLVVEQSCEFPFVIFGLLNIFLLGKDISFISIV